ncbi:MAG: anti-sigma factor antagonist [Candidatus Brocadiaceae bacterium]|nr:anti-sigma factor antagonist [Candidatus Brocadiaceae bacterium]
MPDEIVIKCDNCGHKLVTESRFIGKKGKCPKCGATIRLRQPGAASSGSGEQQVVVEEVETRKDALLRVKKQNDVAIVGFATSRILDQSNVQQLGEEFDALIDQFKLRKIVVNFSGVTYMSSAVMGKLVGLLKKSKASGGRLILCAIEDSIFEIFEIMRFDKMFEISKTEDKAVLELTG